MAADVNIKELHCMLMVGTSFAQDVVGSRTMRLWPGCTDGETDFSCGVHFIVQEHAPRTHTALVFVI